MKTKILVLFLMLFCLISHPASAQTFHDTAISFVLTEEGDDNIIQRLADAGCTNLYDALIYLRNNLDGSAPSTLTENMDALIDTLSMNPGGEVYTASLTDFTGGNSPVGINSDGTFIRADFSIYDYDGHSGYVRYTGDELFTYATSTSYYIYMGSSEIDLGGGATLVMDYKAFAIVWDDEGTPVELTSFTANQRNDFIELNWQTATETNNSGFYVERSLNLRGLGSGDGNPNLGGFVSIGFVEGHGTTTEPQNYSFADKNIENGNYQYRIKQIDYDGTYEYSNIIEVTCNSMPSTFGLFQNYPNPFNPATTIKFSIAYVETPYMASLQLVTLEIYDMLGRKVATLVDEYLPAGKYEREWNADNFPSGIYFCRMEAAEYSQTIKMIIIR